MASTETIYDLVVIGGGINGTGIAADAAGRGLKVFLCEQGDLACATSSNSSKLIHGGLRYLEHYEFKLVKQALAEREVLLKNAPHIIKPLVFRLPYQDHLRPAWMIRAGLFLYDHLAKRITLPGSTSIKFGPDSPLLSNIKKGFEYSDGWVDDARLVISNALAAQTHQASISTRTKCIKASRHNKLWHIELKNTLTGENSKLVARALVNAAGPWVAQLFTDALPSKSPQDVRLVKGSHIIVPRIYQGDEAYILQNTDQRIIFVIPFEQEFSLIGTTDVEYACDPAKVKISAQETDYLLDITNRYFKQKITKQNIVTSFSGVRPLLDDEANDAQTVTRDYTLEIEDLGANHTPLLSVFGGKITTYRKLAEAAVDKLSKYFPHLGSAWTENTPLPGGDFNNIAHFSDAIAKQYPWLPTQLRQRLIRNYGTRIFDLLTESTSLDSLGHCFGGTLYTREVSFLIEREWAMNAEDILWRRTKQGLYLTKQQVEQLQSYLTQHPTLAKYNLASTATA